MKVEFKFLWFAPGGVRYKPKMTHLVPDEWRDQLPSTAIVLSDQEAEAKQRKADGVVEEKGFSLGDMMKQAPKNFIEAMGGKSPSVPLPEPPVLDKREIYDFPGDTSKVPDNEATKLESKDSNLADETSEPAFGVDSDEQVSEKDLKGLFEKGKES